MEKMRRWFRRLSLYHKFALAMILVGLVPMTALATLLANRMVADYRDALQAQYRQAAEYVNSSLGEMLDSCNTISKMPYNYSNSNSDYARRDYLTFDNFRQMIYGEGYDPETMEEERAADVADFLRYLNGVDSSLWCTHFVAPDLMGEKLAFHYSPYSSYFTDEALFEGTVGFGSLDTASNQLLLVPTHETGYFSGMRTRVFTVARNYFDLRGDVGKNEYVGTLFLDVNVNRIEKIFQNVAFTGNETFFVVNEENDCFYSNDGTSLSGNLEAELRELSGQEDHLVIETQKNEYGLRVLVVMNAAQAFGGIRRTQRMVYLVLGASAAVLLLAAVYFSRRLTRPIQAMMGKMEKMEAGDFDILLPVESEDEIGILSRRFNQMSVALKNYINQVYVVQLRQREAELTALKSQIYPHFLYNTLEIIRMTALEDGNEKVPEMIESLSRQIHYLIGPVQDVVPLDRELEMIRNYVYLLNCRISGKVQLMVKARESGKLMIPKLTLQPIVENAYVHGIRPKNSGSICVEAAVDQGVLTISVMDTGVGMEEGALAKLLELLDGDEPGIHDEYNWQSIGLKNVHDRIHLLYGAEYGIQVTSTQNIGTMVQVVMPARYRGNEDPADGTGGQTDGA